MIQGSNILGYERPLVIRISFATCIVVTVCLPLLGLITCVSISSLFHFEDATGTHCQVYDATLTQFPWALEQKQTLSITDLPLYLTVPNYLPSISASISLSPECHIWRFCIGLHSAPRLLVAFTYFRFYKTRFAARSSESTLSCLNLAFSISENLGLLLLTYVSSNETYFVHKEGFVLFIVSSLIYMLITCRLWRSIKKYSLSPGDAKSHHWKVRFLLLNVCFCAFAGFFYWKHNMYCESGSYTFFALFEYLVVFSNMAFHLTAVWDFKSREVVVISSFEDKDF